jgi:hypothetical protein
MHLRCVPERAASITLNQAPEKSGKNARFDAGANSPALPPPEAALTFMAEDQWWLNPFGVY